MSNEFHVSNENSLIYLSNAKVGHEISYTQTSSLLLLDNGHIFFFFSHVDIYMRIIVSWACVSHKRTLDAHKVDGMSSEFWN